MKRRSFIKTSTCAALIIGNAALLTGLVNASQVGGSGVQILKPRNCTIGTCQAVDVFGQQQWWCELVCTEQGQQVASGTLRCDSSGDILDDQGVFGERPESLCDPNFDNVNQP